MTFSSTFADNHLFGFFGVFSCYCFVNVNTYIVFAIHRYIPDNYHSQKFNAKAVNQLQNTAQSQ